MRLKKLASREGVQVVGNAPRHRTKNLDSLFIPRIMGHELVQDYHGYIGPTVFKHLFQ